MRMNKKQLIAKLKIGTIHLIDTYGHLQTTKELKDLLSYMTKREEDLIADMEEERQWKKNHKTKKRK